MKQTPDEAAGGPPWVLIGGVIAVVVLAAVALYPTAGSDSESTAAAEVVTETAAAEPVTETASTAPEPAPVPEPVAAAVEVTKPEPDAPIPPLPFIPNTMPRSPELISEVYEYAARNPDVLEFVPCFCGCETAGHRANAHCFVKSRNADGTVKDWEQHGMGCAVCIDVARDSMQLQASGASVDDVRSAIEAKYAERFPRMTPTPEPPAE